MDNTAAASPVVTVTTPAGKWFKAGETITLTGTVTDPNQAGIRSVTVNGVSAFVSGNDWIYTFVSHEDTSGTPCNVVGIDNLDNFGTSSYMLKVDTEAPVIFDIIATEGYDQSGIRWYQLGAEAAIRATVADRTSGVKACTLRDRSYTPGTAAAIDTSTETSGTDYSFTAMDYAGNLISSTPFIVGVDGTGPAISVTQVPTAWTDLVTVTASASDIGGSGVYSLQYSIDGGRLSDYTGKIEVRKNCTITFVAADNVGNLSTCDYQVANIDEYPPVFTVKADTRTILSSTVFNVFAVDMESAVASLEYRIGDGEWQPYSNGEALKVSTNHQTYTFRAEDTFGNVALETVRFDNIYTEAERQKQVDLADGEFAVQTGDNLVTEMLRLQNAGLTLSETSALTAQSIVMNGGTLDTVSGTAAAHSIRVTGTGNAITGTIGGIGIAAAEIENGAELAISKEQYDEFMTWRRFCSEGTIRVSDASGSGITQDEILLLSKAGNIRSVIFDQELIGLNKLSFDANTSLIVGFAGASGTDGKDSITVQKGANIELGSAGYTIDLAGGKNTVEVKNNAHLVLQSALRNVASVRVAAGKTTKVGKVSGQNYTFADFDAVIFSDRYNGSFKLEKFTNVTAGSITGNEKNDKISIGSNAEASLGDIARIGSITLTAGSKYKVQSTDTEKTQGVTKLLANSITTDQTLKLSLGKFTNAWIGRIVAGGKTDTIKIASDACFNSDYLYLEGGNDKIEFQKNSTGILGGVYMGSGSNTLSLASGAAVTADLLDKVTKLTLSSGSYSKKTGTVTYTSLNVAGGCIATSVNDTFSIGDYVQLNVSGNLDMAGGKDTVKVGHNSIVVLKSADASSISKFTIGKNSEAYLSSELAEKVTKVDKTSEVFDIGEWETAQNFTSLQEENSDDELLLSRSIENEYRGWLGTGLDEIDYVQTDGAKTLTWSNDRDLTLRLWDAGGSSTAASGTEIDVSGYVAFSVEITQKEESASYAYTAKLA